MANAWEIYKKQNESTGQQTREPQSTNPWEIYKASEAYNTAPKKNYHLDQKKSYAQQKYEEAVKRVEEKEKGKFRFGTAAKDAGASILTGAASGFAATGAMLEDLAGGALDTVFKGAGFKGRGLFNTLYNGDTPLAQALRNVGLMDEGIKKTNEYYQNQAAENAEHIDTGNEKRDKVLKKVATGANEIAYGVGNALPMAAGAMLGAPATAANGLAAVGADGLIAQGAKVAENSGMLQTLSQQARTMLKDKDYWTSFAQEVGMDYNEALEDGATEAQAAQYAVATALLNAGIEIGSPAEKSGLQNMAKPLWKSALEEGKEEIEQGPVGRLMKNVVYGKNAPIFSTTDEDAVINPEVMAKEFGMGAAVGGLLGGGQRLVGNAAESIANKMQSGRESKKLGGNGVVPYSEDEMANWSGSKKLTVFQKAEDIKTFVNSALSNSSFVKKGYYGKIGHELAGTIKDATGYDFEGKNLTLRADNVRKIRKDHGSTSKEALRGQRAVEPADYERVPEIIENAESIEKSAYQGKPAAVFSKTAGNEKTNVILVDSGGSLDVYIQTMYINKKGNIADMADDTLSGPLPFTSETPAGTVPDSTISQIGTEVKADGMQEVPYVSEEDQISDAAMEFAYELGRKGARENERSESGVREGGQRNDGAGADGQAGGVEERAGEAKDAEAKEPEAKHLKGRPFRKEDLTTGVKAQATVQMVTEGETKSMKRARVIGKKRSLAVHFFRGGNLIVNGVTANGCICDGEVWIRADDPEYTAEQIMRHEAKHDAIAKGEVDPYEEWQKLEQRFGVDRMDSYVEAYAEAVAGTDLSEAEIEEEILCDAAGGMNKFEGKLDLVAAEFGEVLDAAAQETTQENTERGPPEGEKNTAKTGGVKASSVGREEAQEKITKKYQRTVSDVLNAGVRVNGTVMMGYTPNLYQKLGMPSLPFVVGGRHIYTTAKTEAEAKAEGRYKKNEHYHGLGEEVVKDLYEFVQDPVAIIAAKDVNKNTTPMRSTHSVVAIIDVGTKESLLMPIVITAESSIDGERYDVNLLSSVYEKNVSELMREAIAQFNTGENSIYYIKKEADSLISQGVQFPRGLSAVAASNGIVCRFPEKVNMKILEATQSMQFKRWFGDWQNEPNTASKVVNDDGTPKVVYHGTDAESIHVFKNESGAYWFSESEDYAEAMAEERGGRNIQSAYLDMKKPYHVLLPEGKFSDPAAEKPYIRYAKEHGYDGVIFETDTDNELVYDKFYVVFDSKQIKSATENVGTFDKSNPDVRFSATGTEAVAALEEQNNALKEQVKQLNREKAKLQKQVNKWKNEATFSPERVGRDIIKAYSSTVKEADIHDGVYRLLQYASDKSGVISYKKMKEMAAGVADKIVRNAETLVNSETQQEYNAIKDYHKQAKLVVTMDMKRDFADWKNWWREHGRGLHVVIGEKSNIDTVYTEMRERFGEGYYPADIINPTDQLRRMAEVLANLKPIMENPYKSYNMAYATEACANDLLDMVMAEVSRGYTGTITYQLNEELYRARREVGELKQHAIGAENKRRDEARELARRAIEEENKRRDEARVQLHTEREQRWKTEEKRAARRKIASTVRTLDRALRNPTDNNHIPDELRGTVQELCSIFTNNRAEVLQEGARIQVDDHAIFDAEKLAKARAYYSDLKGAEGFKDVYDEETAERLKFLEETIAGKRLSSLTLEELRDVKAVVEHIRFVTRTADEMFINGRKSKIQSVAQGIMIGADMKGTHEEITLKDGKGLSLKRMIAEGNLKPEYFFRRLGDSALSNMWHDMLKGQNTYAFGLSEAKEFREKVDAELETGKWMDSKKTLEMKDAAGCSMEVSMGQAMYMVAAYKRERLNGNTNHVLGGGFVFEEEVVKDYKVLGMKALEKRVYRKKPHTMNEQTMEEVEKWLIKQDERTMEYVDRMVAYLSNDMAEKGNKTSMHLHGYKKFLEKYYIPMQSSREFLEKRFDSSKTNSGTNYKNKGMTKRTTQGANNPIVLREFDEVWAKHVNEMLLYNAMAVQQDNLQRIMNYKTPVDKVGTMPSDSVRAALTEAYGGEAVQYVDTLMKDINGGLMTDSREAGVNSMISLFKKNAVFASLSVAIQQPSSIARAMAVMDGKYLMQTVSQKRDYEELKKYSGVAIIKEIGGFDTTTGRSGSDWLMDSRADKTAMEKLDTVGSYLPGKMDEITWCHIWNAVKAEIADTTDLTVGSEKYFERCGERFNEVIELTQVYDSVLTRSENMRSQSGVLKIATSFMAEPTVTLNMVAEAVHNVRGKKKGAWGKLGRTMGAVLISILLNNLLKAIVTAPRDKDKDKNILEKYAGKFASGVVQDIEPWNYVPLVKDLSEIMSGYSVEVPYWQTFENAYKGVKGLWDDTDHMRAILRGDMSGVTVDGVADAVNGIAGLFGIPAKNVWRDFDGVVTLFKETAPIKDASFGGAVDAAWEAVKGSKSTSERVEDYYYAYRGKSAIKQRNATKDMEKLWQSKYKSYLAKGYSEKEAKSKANSAVKSSVTQALKPKYQAAKTQAERNRIIEVARHLYLGDRQLYAGYNFTKEWSAEN